MSKCPQLLAEKSELNGRRGSADQLIRATEPASSHTNTMKKKKAETGYGVHHHVNHIQPMPTSHHATIKFS